jgi:hypothetical protein
VGSGNAQVAAALASNEVLPFGEMSWLDRSYFVAFVQYCITCTYFGPWILVTTVDVYN